MSKHGASVGNIDTILDDLVIRLSSMDSLFLLKTLDTMVKMAYSGHSRGIVGGSSSRGSSSHDGSVGSCIGHSKSVDDNGDGGKNDGGNNGGKVKEITAEMTAVVMMVESVAIMAILMAPETGSRRQR